MVIPFIAAFLAVIAVDNLFIWEMMLSLLKDNALFVNMKMLSLWNDNAFIVASWWCHSIIILSLWNNYAFNVIWQCFYLGMIMLFIEDRIRGNCILSQAGNNRHVCIKHQMWHSLWYHGIIRCLILHYCRFPVKPTVKVALEIMKVGRKIKWLQILK